MLGLVGACRSAPAGARTPFFVAIEAANRHLEEQFRSGNLLGIADLYTEDAVRIDGQGQRAEGRQEIDAHWSSIESPVAWRLEIRSIHGTDAVAYETGTSHLTSRRDGELVTSTTPFLWLWRRTGEGWRIELDFVWPPEEP